ncbi:hypothetical protein OAN47_03570 [Planctomycetota bacterium]|nr:hypothetical protein [Planctomycetota bacterium]
MKINPWIVVTLLALACGYLVGARTENEAEAQVSEGPQWKYMSGTFTAANSPYVIRVDVSDPNPIPEFYAVEPEDMTWGHITGVHYWSKSVHDPPKAKKK